MKVGVITFHSAFNYGASLQTWALQKVLRSYGCEAYVIHYHPDVIDRLYDPIQCTGAIKRFRKIMKLRKKSKSRLERYYKYSDFIKNNFNLLGDFKTYEELCQADLGLDVYITGSDQVWNSQHIGGFDPAYALDFADGDAVKISYAASIGKNYIMKSHQENYRNSLESYYQVSVREISAKKAVQALTDKEVEVVLDPTLLLEKNDYEELKANIPVRGRYILVYMMEKSKDVITFANRISVSLGIPVIQRRPNKMFRNELPSFYSADPGEFIGLIEKAEMVITNSFHGTVFSIIYERPFISMLHSETGSRTVDLLETLGLESHLLYDITEFRGLQQFELGDVEQLKKRTRELQRESRKFLEKALHIASIEDDVKCPTGIKKKECYGCFACKEICPTKAITMKQDDEGFYYPHVDESLCVHCGVCEKACIRLKDMTVKKEKDFPKVYAAMNKNEEVRMGGSSSGALFPELCQYAIEEKKGVVVGVKYDEDMLAVSAIAGNLEDTKAFYGSKYVKSEFDGMFPKIKKLLDAGTYVLYSGLPCECAGLRSFLKKDYANLLISEILCHAVPSQKVFQKYLTYLNHKMNSKVVDFVFRNKDTGWDIHKCSMIIRFKNGKELKVNSRRNNYFRAFLNDILDRPSCCNCQFTFKERVGDITIGDYWGIKEVDPSMYDNKGVSVVTVNTEKGKTAWDAVADRFTVKETTLWQAFKKNHNKPSAYKTERVEFYSRLNKERINPLLESFNDLKKVNN